MDQSLLKEIHYLTCLIEHHKKKSIEKSCCVKETLLNPHSAFTKSLNYTNFIQKYEPLSKNYSSISHDKVTTTNVYVNPNFKPQNSSIHINPRLKEKPVVHVNPKMMKNVINSNENMKTDPISKATSNKDNLLQNQNSLKKSVYVNPKLMKKLSSSIQPKSVEPEETVIQNINHPVCSRLKFVKNATPPKNVHNPRKTSNSNIVLLSRRKLVRVRRNSRKSLNTSQTEFPKIKKSLNVMKNTKFSSYKTVKTKTVLQQPVNKDVSSTKSLIVKPKINKYRIDRTVPKILNIKEHSNQTQKKVMNKKMELITIGGIVYKSSKNQLVRKSYGVKKKRVANIKSDKFIVATNGKKLCRIKPLKETLGSSRLKVLNKTNSTRFSSNLSQKINYKTNISNKVKQRSIQILRNKMQKNNQPCLIFQRFGYCSNHEKGTCLKRHDKKQISLCKKFLQGNCLLDKCPLSHDVGPEKMPTCKYFLEGCCIRDCCPYRHIKVSSSTPICREFLQGYCAKGQECKQRHENICPEFEKMEKCSKGKHCPYPHKSHTSSVKQNHLKRKYDLCDSQVAHSKLKDISSNNENRLRYYEQTDTDTDKNLNKKRESLIRKVKLMKGITPTNTLVEVADTNIINLESVDDDCKLEDDSDTKVTKRPPIGVLPSYIPIG